MREQDASLVAPLPAATPFVSPGFPLSNDIFINLRDGTTIGLLWAPNGAIAPESSDHEHDRRDMPRGFWLRAPVTPFFAT